MQLVMKVVSDNKDTVPPSPLSFLNRYIIIITQEDNLTTCTERDVEKVTFSSQQGSDVIFLDSHKNSIVCKEADYGKKWLLINQDSIYGTLLSKAYDDLLSAIRGSLPHHLRDKVK